jgi:hypothetical protein
MVEVTKAGYGVLWEGHPLRVYFAGGDRLRQNTERRSAPIYLEFSTEFEVAKLVAGEFFRPSESSVPSRESLLWPQRQFV